MQVSLHITEGPYEGETLVVPTGTSLVLGRTDVATRSFPNDLQMSSRHVEIAFDGQVCTIRDLNSTNGTYVNRERITEYAAKSGDSLVAGNSTFLINIPIPSGPAQQAPPGAVGTMRESATATTPESAAAIARASAPPAPAPPAPAPPAAAPPPAPVPPPVAPSRAAAPQTAVASPPAAAPPAHNHAQPPTPDQPPAIVAAESLTDSTAFVAPTAAEICQAYEPGETAAAILQDTMSPKAFIDLLVQGEFYNEALEFLAHALPRRAAVGWATRCIRQFCELSPLDQKALDCCEQWLLGPSEALRRQAEAAAMELEHQTPAAWVAMGVVWSHGSIAPPESPAVPGSPGLCGKALTGAMQMAPVVQQPENAQEKQKAFIDLGVMLGSS